MVNFNDFEVILIISWRSNGLWSVVDGIFIWEIVTTLDYEWNVIRGRRPYRWTIWLYSLTRLATLAAVTLNMNTLPVRTIVNPNCEVTLNIQFILGYLALAASSLLTVLRIITIWDRNKIIVALATGLWVTTIAFLIQVVDPGCVFQLNSTRLSTIGVFAANTILLLIMLFGLYRLRRRGSPMTLGRLLWNQGVVWLLFVVTAELSPMVLLILNLIPSLNITIQIPWIIAMSIAATRMYRSLPDFLSSDVPQKITPTSCQIASENNGTSTAPILLTGIQVVVHEAHEQDGTPQTNHFGSRDHDMEGAAEK